ncbi:MAG: retroviral-like aspartic protease family protein [Isosphaeraceae bacterium]
MGTDAMGRVTVAAKIENVSELFQAEEGRFPADQVHRVEVSDALVDTGATTLSMPGSLIKKLNLKPLRSRTARTTAGLSTFHVYGAVRLTVQGRECTIDVAEVPEDCPVLIGQVPLELLDFVVDPTHQCLIGNPAHGGEQMIEMY